MTLPPTIDSVRLASRTRRLVAQLIDDAIALVPALLLLLVVGGDMGDRGGIAFRLATLLGLGYILVSDGFAGGQSFGKRVLGMAVVDAQSGDSCSMGQSITRNLMLAALNIIDWVFIFGERRQRLGDKLARTIVIDV